MKKRWHECLASHLFTSEKHPCPLPPHRRDKSHRVTVAAVRTGQPSRPASRSPAPTLQESGLLPGEPHRTASHTNGVHPPIHPTNSHPILLFPRVPAQGRQPGNLPVGGSTVRYRYSKPCRCRCSAVRVGPCVQRLVRTVHHHLVDTEGPQGGMQQSMPKQSESHTLTPSSPLHLERRQKARA